LHNFGNRFVGDASEEWSRKCVNPSTFITRRSFCFIKLNEESNEFLEGILRPTVERFKTREPFIALLVFDLAMPANVDQSLE